MLRGTGVCTERRRRSRAASGGKLVRRLTPNRPRGRASQIGPQKPKGRRISRAHAIATTLGGAPAAVDAAGAPSDRQQSTQTALLGAERFPDVSTALSTTLVNPMPCTVQYAIVELPPMMLSG